ncbi:hypothetical protein Y048_4202 [Burkholderia pseudomallei MSHR456]|nr:hypothetical protein Y048_4202 [Burkholderia pseudomallei MSHR456]
MVVVLRVLAKHRQMGRRWGSPIALKKVANVLQNNEIDLHDAIYQHSDRSSFRLIGSIPAWKQQTKARGARRGGFGGEGEEGAPGGE